MFVSGQNMAVDDLFSRFRAMWESIGGPIIRKGNEPVAVRLYSVKSESRDFVRRFANVGRVIQRQVEDESTSGIVMRLLNWVSSSL